MPALTVLVGVLNILGGAVRPDILLYTHPDYGPPDAIAESSLQCVAEGYKAIKLHTWMPPYSADVKRDRSAVCGWPGTDINGYAYQRGGLVDCSNRSSCGRHSRYKQHPRVFAGAQPVA